jgi:SAM-dependent methyltransferase
MAFNMSVWATSLKDRRHKSRLVIRKHYHDRGWQSPYRLYEQSLRELLAPSATVLDVGCGRDFPMAKALKATGARVFGLDPVADTGQTDPEVVVRRGLAENIPYDAGMFDVVTSCAVLEHMYKPRLAFAEFNRVLKPDGRLVFLTAGRYDYVSIISRLIPNYLHGWIVQATEGRNQADTFPTFYRANDMRQIRLIAAKSGFRVEQMEYLNEYPYALAFSPALCRLGIAYDRLIQRSPWLHWLKGWLLGVLQRQGEPGRALKA